MGSSLRGLCAASLVSCFIACSSPPAVAPSRADLLEDLSAVEASVQKLRAAIEGLPMDEPEANHTHLTIVRTIWSDDPGLSAGLRTKPDEPARLYCHVAEWQGFPAMKRFTAQADPVFYLEAPGHAPVSGQMAVGGVSNTDGAWREVILHLGKGGQAQLQPAVAYRLRPRNDTPGYRWRVAEHVLVTAP